VNVLIIDSDGTGLDMAYRAAESGHTVRWWVAPHEDRSPVRDGDGFTGIEKVSSWRPHGAWAKDGLIVNLYNDKAITRELDKWRSFGLPVFGPSARSAELEWNRGKGMKFLEAAGIEVPHYETFDSLDAAITFAWKADRPYVFKTLGDEEDKSLSYVAESPADLVGWLETQRDHGLKLKGQCMLQEKVELIAEVGVSAWMGKDGFLPGKWNINFEHKKLMPGDFGPNTGEMLTVCKYASESRIADDILAPIEEALVKLGHRGDTDVGCGIDKKGRALPFEFTNRFGWPSTFILMHCHRGDPVQWMKDALDGDDSLSVDDRVAIGVLMAMPPFPNKNEEPRLTEGFVVSGIEDVWDSVSPWQLMITEGPVDAGGGVEKGKVFRTSGEYVCVVNALGDDVHDAISEVYAKADLVKFKDRIVRNDGGKKLEQQLPKLHAFGYDEMPNW
jgi:phosphoribosylamine---glycine ligase